MESILEELCHNINQWDASFVKKVLLQNKTKMLAELKSSLSINYIKANALNLRAFFLFVLIWKLIIDNY